MQVRVWHVRVRGHCRVVVVVPADADAATARAAGEDRAAHLRADAHAGGRLRRLAQWERAHHDAQLHQVQRQHSRRGAGCSCRGRRLRCCGRGGSGGLDRLGVRERGLREETMEQRVEAERTGELLRDARVGATWLPTRGAGAGTRTRASRRSSCSSCSSSSRRT